MSGDLHSIILPLQRLCVVHVVHTVDVIQRCAVLAVLRLVACYTVLCPVYFSTDPVCTLS